MRCHHTWRTLGSALSLLLIIVLPPLQARERRKKEPKHMPAQILTAKTVHLDLSIEMDENPFYVKQCLEEQKRFRVVESHQQADLNIRIEVWPPHTALRLTVWDPGYRHILWTLTVPGGTGRIHCCFAISIFNDQIEEEIARRDRESAKRP